jgi:RNA polymerase sigma-70 factor, ECF subfamily
VSTHRRSDGVRHDAAPGTLGALLYAQPKERAPESDWVELVVATSRQDPSALRALYERAHRLVFTLSMRITGDRLAAEEVTLDVFLEVWRRAGTYDAAQNTVIGWLMNLTRSRAIDRVRFESRKKRTVPSGARSSIEEDYVDGPVGALDARDTARIIGRALQGLTAAERQAIEATFFSELTYAEAAERLNQPLGTVKTRIRSGLAKLRQALGGNGDAS